MLSPPAATGGINHRSKGLPPDFTLYTSNFTLLLPFPLLRPRIAGRIHPNPEVVGSHELEGRKTRCHAAGDRRGALPCRTTAAFPPQRAYPMIVSEFYAHSAGYSGREQPQQEHLSEVEARAIRRCPVFLLNDVRLAALFHDFGKYSILFKRRLEGLESGLDHWSPGAHLLLQNGLSELAGIGVHAHHVGLGAWSQVSTLRENLVSLENRTLTLADRDGLNGALQAMLNDGFTPQDYAKGRKLKRTVGSMLDARMVLSSLVDADYADTARHLRGEERPIAPTLDAELALAALQLHVASLGQKAGASEDVLKVRRDLWDAAIKAAESQPGLYELEAPTGSGKTLAMLGFALRHIISHKPLGLRRIVVALPFLSILDQTVRSYREALGEHAVGLLEHHSLAEWRKLGEEDGESDERRTAEALSQDWEAPIIITTTVQLLESLFTDHPATSRKLCALSKAVILLDEAQSIPSRLITPTLRAISRLCHPDYGSTVVVATATQPLFSRFAKEIEQEKDNIGWCPIPMAQRTLRLYARTRRYDIDWSRCQSPVAWETIADELAGEDRALCIVNTRKDARHLTELVLDRSPNARVIHLSTNMCATHRRTTLDRKALKNRTNPSLLISTQCVEAGVDLDFPVVYRALAPLDSVAQAAGRCNRGGTGKGTVCVFLPEDARYPGDRYEQGARQTLSLLTERENLDPQDPEVFDLYFQRFYDLSAHPGTSRAMEQAIKGADFPEVARLYHLIDHRNLLHIIVPYTGVPAIPHRLTGAFFRMVQPFVVEANRKDAALSA